VHPIVEGLVRLGEIEVPADGLYGNLAGGKEPGSSRGFFSARFGRTLRPLRHLSANRQAAIFCRTSQPIGSVASAAL
jgi:hypothetical protein